MVYQLPELPTGCEITALTMALQYYGLDADKTEMAADYLPTSPSTNRYTGSDGRVYGIDLDAYFVGNPFDDSGMICGPAAIVTAANGFLADQGSSLQAADCTGASPDALYALVEQNTPVVVWVTIGMTPRQPAQMSWYTETGKYVDWTNNDHCAVLVGYTDSSVWIADPLAGLVEYSKTSFERVFASRGTGAWCCSNTAVWRRDSPKREAPLFAGTGWALFHPSFSQSTGCFPRGIVL